MYLCGLHYINQLLIYIIFKERILLNSINLASVLAPEVICCEKRCFIGTLDEPRSMRLTCKPMSNSKTEPVLCKINGKIPVMSIPGP
jgi:hypothetical protein